MSNYKEIPLDWRVSLLSLVGVSLNDEERETEPAAIVARFCEENDAEAYAKSCAEDAAIAVVSHRRNGVWHTEQVHWDKDYTGEAATQLGAFPPSVKGMFYEAQE